MSTSAKPAWMRARRPMVFYIASASAIAALFVYFSSFSQRFTPTKPHHNLRPYPSVPVPLSDGQGRTWRFEPIRDARNLHLSDEQCDIAFPKLYTELDRARDHFGPASIHQDQIKIHPDNKPYKHGQLHVLIYNGQMYVINEKKGASNRARGLAGLANLYRAITAVDDPTTIPDVEFILDIEDTPTVGVPEDRVVWSWNRPKTNLNTWVVPDFDGWAFPKSDLGSYLSFRERLQFIETPFEDKDPRPVWRGALNNKVRVALMNVTNETDWADVQKLTPDTRMHMAEFCKYQFPIHTEGNTWSGRLRYIHNCNSAPVIHQPLQHQAHYYDLLVHEGPDQNYIKVNNDFSDLQEKIEYYRAHPSEAARIANNSANTFRDQYLTPAAEACYWRRLIHRWAEVQAFKPNAYVDVKQADGSVWKKQRGVDWEVFAHPDSKYPVKFEEDG